MEVLKLFKTFLDELVVETSINYKLNILEKYKDNEDIKFILNYIFNPYIINGISSQKIIKYFNKLPEVFLNSKQLLIYLADRRTGDNEALKHMQGFALKLDNELKNIFYKIVIKNLPIGIGVLSINKVIPGLIPTFNIMLATKYSSNLEYFQGKDFTLTRKIDGNRIIMLKDNGEVKFYTRAGQLYEGLYELELAAKKLPDNIMLDGELTLLKTQGLNSKLQYKETTKITRTKGLKNGLKILVFDILSIKDFYSQSCNTPYIERRKQLDKIILNKAAPYFEVLPILYQGNDQSIIAKVLEEQLIKGEEGIMLNINEAAYEFKRSKNLLKIKKMQDIDLKVVDLEEGMNTNKGKLGAFVVRYKDNLVKVGSGIDKATREEVWSNKEEYINSIIKVQYFEETTNIDGKASLRFPVFLGFRTDKLEDL